MARGKQLTLVRRIDAASSRLQTNHLCPNQGHRLYLRHRYGIASGIHPRSTAATKWAISGTYSKSISLCKPRAHRKM
eukprot:scaffold38353_cov31-Tisochrysis_lutea.AAC.7